MEHSCPSNVVPANISQPLGRAFRGVADIRKRLSRLCFFRVSRTFLSILACASISLSALGAALPSPQVCVLYPDVGEPYARITHEILNGIAERLNAPKPCTLALPEQANKRAVQGWLSHHSPNVVITLGRLANRVFEASGSRIPSVVGALDISPETRPDASGISLAVDPGVMFDRLKRMAPGVKRVFFAYEPGHDGWLLEHAKKEAAARGLELRAEPADGVLQGAERYGHFAQIAQPHSDAIWLTLNNAIIDDSSLVPYLIEKAWYRKLIIVSNKLQHAQWGVSFATYPNNRALGHRLAEMALRLTGHPEESLGVAPLRDIKIAPNTRIMNHLGLPMGSTSNFEIIYE